VSKEAITAAAQGRFFWKKLGAKRGHAHLQHLPTPRTWADVDALHERIRTSATLISLQHDAALFEWLETEGRNRFLKVFSYEGEVLRAYLCIHLDEKDSFAPVLDFCADSAESLMAAVQHVRQALLKHGFSALFFTLNVENAEQRQYLAHLRQLGASNYGKVGTWVIKPLCLAQSPLYDNMQSWYLTDLWFALFNREAL
jgi:hypothetical protein